MVRYVQGGGSDRRAWASMCWWAWRQGAACRQPKQQAVGRPNHPYTLTLPLQTVPRQHAVRERQARARPVQAEPRHAAGAVRHRRPRRIRAAAGERHQGVALVMGCRVLQLQWRRKRLHAGRASCDALLRCELVRVFTTLSPPAAPRAAEQGVEGGGHDAAGPAAIP